MATATEERVKEKQLFRRVLDTADLERAIAWYADNPAGAVRVMERITRRLAETERQVGHSSKATPGLGPKR